MAWTCITKSVAAAGTRERLVSTSTLALDVLIQPKTANTGVVAIGDSTVSVTKGIILEEPHADTQIAILSLASILLRQPIELYDLYIDSAVNGEGVNILYLPAP